MEQSQLTYQQWAKACINVLVLELYFPTAEAKRHFYETISFGSLQWFHIITPFEAVLESL